MFNNKRNKIILHKLDGSVKQVHRIKGLRISFKGCNNCVEIYEPYKFRFKLFANKSKFRINGNNNHLIIKESSHLFESIKIRGVQDNCKIIIEENFYQTGNVFIDFANQSNLELFIGKNCMFGQNVSLMLADFHKIIDLSTSEQTNIPKKGIHIGDHVWIARNATVLKDITIAENSVVAMNSTVTKSITEPNVLIGGIPAKILKRNITWLQ